ncbi:aldo/keto reductase [Macrococcus capreoli]|uniref:aldo/keto reductase n=1 Tax=Macrococcus capreoli TaxID=2982690 RepID=UPI0021D5E9B2|nr:aldo/keto reductase [Macrococcus sp. TMW 2.2395]MCU7556791.1 aldo/keto reductase [Macrococcus sp. TMW 2.2395]
MKFNTTKSGIKFSELGFGAMNLPNDAIDSQYILDQAVDLGITYIDTADLYQKGQNEKNIGHFIKQSKKRDQITLASKVGNRFNMVNDDVQWDPSKAHIKQSIHESLKRLETDYLDLYMLHGGTIEDQMDETIETFENLKKEGLIRAYGISSIRPNVIDYYLKHSQIDTIMMQFNFIDNRPTDLIDAIQSENVKILARGPLMKGLLTDQSEAVLNKKFREGTLGLTYDTIKEGVQIAQQIAPLQQAVYQYLSSYDVASIVNGASTVEQLKANVRAYEQMKDDPIETDALNQMIHAFKSIQYEDHLV